MLKALKSLFIIEEEGPKSRKKPTTKKSSSSSKPTKPAPVTTSTIKESIKGRTGRVDSKFVDILFQAMEKNNIDGFDYLEFKESLKSLEKMPMDEATRFKSAYAMAQTMGASAKQLEQTAQHYINVLKTEEKKFEQALENQRNNQIGSKKSELTKVEEIIKAKAAQIKALTQEIEASQKKVNVLKDQIEHASVKVENTKNDFIASYNMLVAQIDKDVDSIKKYLKNSQ